MAETNRDKALRGEVVRVTDSRLKEMQQQAITQEGFGPYRYHWHWAALVNETIFLRRIAAAAAKLRGIELTPASGDSEHV
jgi:hypothetical protein